MGDQTSVRTTKLPDPPPPPPPDLFANSRIHVAPDGFDGQSLQLLTNLALAMGATVVKQDSEATLRLHNPCSPASARAGGTGLTGSSVNGRRPDSPLPYHYLGSCAQARKVIPPKELDPPLPIFVHPGSQAFDIARGVPLKIWTSANVQKSPHEVRAEDARDAVMDMVTRRGALAVSKRSMADILVVDKTTAFYAVILNEIETHGRRGKQKVVERDWVETCVKRGKLLWDEERVQEQNDAAGTKQDDEIASQADSFEDEGPVDRKGPGRPTGKPRVEYSPEDDDFLCRYLAVYQPAGSWSSRKTYQMLAADEARYPIIGRHSDQSWQERFKKNAGAFTKRVKRYLTLDLDETLKTAAERRKAAGTAQSSPEHPAAAAANSTTRPPAAGTTAHAPRKETRRPQPLVQLDDESAHSTPAAQAAIGEKHPAPKDQAAAAGLAAAPSPALDASFDPLPAVELSLRPNDHRPTAGVRHADPESQLTKGLSHTRSKGSQSAATNTQAFDLETQDLVGDYERAKAAVEAAKVDQQIVLEQLAVTASTREVLIPGSSSSRVPTAGPSVPTTPGLPQRDPTGAQTIATQTPVINDSNGGTRTEARLVNVEVSRISTEVTPARARAGRPRSSISNELQNSAAKRRQRLSSGTPRKSMPAQPDLVPVSTGLRPPTKRSADDAFHHSNAADAYADLPPALAERARAAAQQTSTSPQQEPPAKQVKLTPSEHAASVAKGKGLVQDSKLLYRRKINEWCSAFGVDVRVLVNAMTAIKEKNGGAPLNFDELEVQLKAVWPKRAML